MSFSVHARTTREFEYTFAPTVETSGGEGEL